MAKLSNLLMCAHVLLGMNHLGFRSIDEALPLAKDLLRTHGHFMDWFGERIEETMSELGIGQNDIITRAELIAVIELAAERERK